MKNIINLPGFASASVVLIAELHGRMGHFPTVIRLKKVEGSLPPVFDVEEIVKISERSGMNQEHAGEKSSYLFKLIHYISEI